MASYHLSVKSVRRSEGRSATAAAAYRHAERIECHREGRTHDYRAKQGVEHSFIVVPEDAPSWAQDRQALWNAAEARETRVNSVTAREWELALPAELDAGERRLLVAGFAAELVARYGVAADVAIHAPHREGDQRNWHAHVLTTTRALTHDGLTDKTRVLDAKQTGGPEVEHMRGRWAEMQNHALEQHGHEERVDHRTLHSQREAALSHGDEARAEELDRAAEVKLGPVVSAVERRERRHAERDGHEYVPVTERGTQVHEARQARTLLAELAEVRDRLRHELHQRLELARETYAHAREEGAHRIGAGLAALRAAAQKHGLAQGQEHGQRHQPTHGLGQGLTRHQERDDEARHERQASRASIKDRLARLLEREAGHAHAVEGPSIEERLARLTGRQAGHDETGHDNTGHDGAGSARTPAPEHGHGLENIQERLGRLLERQQERSHESIREELSAALARARPVAQEDTHDAEHERHRETHRHRQRGHEDDGHGWGL